MGRGENLGQIPPEEKELDEIAFIRSEHSDGYFKEKSKEEPEEMFYPDRREELQSIDDERYVQYPSFDGDGDDLPIPIRRRLTEGSAGNIGYCEISFFGVLALIFRR